MEKAIWMIVGRIVFDVDLEVFLWRGHVTCEIEERSGVASVTYI